MPTAEIIKSYAHRFIGVKEKEPLVIRAYCWYYLLARVTGDERWRAVYSKPCKGYIYMVAIDGNDDEREALAKALLEDIRAGDAEALGLFIANDEICGNKYISLIKPEDLGNVMRNIGIEYLKIMLGQSEKQVWEGELFEKPWLFLGTILRRRGSPWTKMSLET